MLYLEIGAIRVEERDRRDPHKRRNILKSGSAFAWMGFRFNSFKNSDRNVN